jgi:hypothetical protein
MKDLPITMMPDGWMEKTGGYAKDMTLRDYFAAKAMQALIRSAPNGTTFGASSEMTNSTYAFASYAVADAMLKAGQ